MTARSNAGSFDAGVAADPLLEELADDDMHQAVGPDGTTSMNRHAVFGVDRGARPPARRR
jgi:hypothetical protein